jgi:hypothetical protein
MCFSAFKVAKDLTCVSNLRLLVRGCMRRRVRGWWICSQIPPRIKGIKVQARNQIKYTTWARVASAKRARKMYAAMLLGRYSQKTTTMVPLTTGPKGGPSLRARGSIRGGGD